MTTDAGHLSRVPILLRNRDMDTLGHLNQSLYHVFVEEARTRVLVDVLGTEEIDFVLAHVSLDHRREVRMSEREVVAEGWVEKVGTSSVHVGSRVLKPDGTVAAEGVTVLVGWDPGTRSARKLSEDERALLHAAIGPRP
jgi:acyl-CoA thioester hydrolase